MFFSMKRSEEDEEDTPIDKRKKVSLSSIVNKLHDGKSPSPTKTAPTGTGLLSVVTTIAAIDPTGREAGLSSDELVKKLFKGLSVPMYKPQVPPSYLKLEVPSAIKDYRWGAFDLPIYHDTMLSIARPPTPPPAVEPEPLLLTTVAFSPPHPAEEPGRAQSSKQGRTEQKEQEQPQQSSRASSKQQHSARQQPSQQEPKPESQQSRKHPSREQPERENSIKPSSSSKGSTQQATTGDDLQAMKSSRSSRPPTNQHQASMTAILEAEGSEHSPSPERSKSTNNLFAPNSSSSSRSGKLPSAGGLDGDFAALALFSGRSTRGASTGAQGPGEAPRSGRVEPAARTAGAVAMAMSSGRSERLSREYEGPSEAPSNSEAADASIEALLQLDSLEAQRQYLKQDNNDSDDAVSEQGPEQAHNEQLGASAPHSQRDSVDRQEAPEGPVTTQENITTTTTDDNTGMATSPATTATAAKSGGKIITPASRSVFKPTFAAPRPPESTSVTSPPAPAVMSDHQLYMQQFGQQHSTHMQQQHHQAAEVGGGQINGVLVGSTPARKNGFSVLEETFLNDHSPAYHVKPANYAQFQQPPLSQFSPEDYAREREQRARAMQDNDEQEGRSGEKAEEEDHREHKHHHHHKHHHKHGASPIKRWYMAGAYSSHSEAMDAIHKLTRIVEHHGVEGDPSDEQGDEGRFRLQRDLSRMQWVVECSDSANKQLILSHASKSGSTEKDKEKYRRIVQSVQQKISPQAKPQPQPLHEKEWDLSPPVQRPTGNKWQVQQRKEEKYLRERDAHYEHNLRQIRHQLPKEDTSPVHQQGHSRRHDAGEAAAGGSRFPPIAQQYQVPQQQEGGGRQKGAGKKGKRKG